MLEVVVVILLCRGMGKMMRNKGRKPLLFQIMLVVMWIGGEFSAPFMYGLISAIRSGGNVELGWEVYLIALAGAAAGAGITFLTASLVPPARRVPVSYRSHDGIAAPSLDFAPSHDPNNPYQPPRT